MSTSQQLNKNASASTMSGSSLGGRPSTVVAGEQAQPVSVQSQLASSTVQGGSVTSKSNLESIVADLGSAHNAHTGWLEAETQKITQWGNAEIARLMEQTKGVEQKLVAEAQLKQKALDESHKAELSRVVQELDAKKAMQLKELEDGLQRQIQSALDSSKADINNIESEMNKRKMALMQKAQEQTAKDVSRLTNLSVEAKLVPSTTRTVIETNTNTGTVVAVAGGGAISTGAAQASTIATEKVQAAPMAGTVSQGADVTRGDIIRDADQRKVGDGIIVNTKTDVQQHTNQQPIQGAQPGSIQAQGRPVNAGVTIHEDPQQVPNMHSTSLPLKKDTINTTSVAGSSLGQDASKRIDASYGAQPRGTTATTGLGSAYDQYASTIPAGTIDGRPIGDQTLAGSKSLGGADPAYNKHGSTEGTHHKEGLLSKIKHAVTGEPRSNDAHNRL